MRMFSHRMMLALAATLIAPSSVFGVPSRYTNSTTPRSNQPHPTGTGSPSAYKKIADFCHPRFFDDFDLFDEGDPTLGSITYVDKAKAKAKELIGWVYYEEDKASNAYVSLDHIGINSHRDSVRLVSKQTFEPGTLTVIDVRHVPTGPGLWPAVWFLAPESEGSWPGAGEMDIMEWVNDVKYNAMTLHTGPGCTVDRALDSYIGELGETDCNTGSDEGIEGAIGCSIAAPKNYTINGRKMATAGPGFNEQGGGVYVHEWLADSISVWLFPRDKLPSDLEAGKPNPKTWTQKPLAKWTGSGCDFSKAFKPQQLIINIDLCGQWAGKDFPGGWDKCNSFVEKTPEAFKDAYFDFASIKMYSVN